MIDEFAEPLRLLLHRLPASRRASSRSAEACRTQPEAAFAGLAIWGLVNGVLVFNGLCRTAVRLARARPCGRGGGRVALGAAVAERPRAAAALLRKELDRHLPRVLPADGGEPHAAAQDRLDRRRRHDLGAGDGRRRGRRAGAVLGGARTPSCASCSSGRSASGSHPSRGSRCRPRSSRGYPPSGATPGKRRCQMGRGLTTFGPAMPAAKPTESVMSAEAAPPCRRARRPRAEEGRPRLPGRRLGLHFPRLSRAAAARRASRTGCSSTPSPASATCCGSSCAT